MDTALVLVFEPSGISRILLYGTYLLRWWCEGRKGAQRRGRTVPEVTKVLNMGAVPSLRFQTWACSLGVGMLLLDPSDIDRRFSMHRA